MNKMNIKTIASTKEVERRKAFFKSFINNPIPDIEKLNNLGLFTKRQELTKTIYLNELYKQILEVHGVIIEFGVRWGQNLVTLSNLRGIYEPYNYSRKIIGFDTFTGFESTSPKDGTHDIIKDGAFAVTKGYEKYLEEILNYHESESPLEHINKFKIVKGNAIDEIKNYLNEHPETIISFAIFDFDIYEPTLKCLKTILPYMAKGGIIAFDELVDPHFPGETVAYRELLACNFKIKRLPICGIQSYLVYE